MGLRYKNDELVFKAEDVRDFTGITDGQIYAARSRGDLQPIQEAPGGDCYYRAEEILAIHRRILQMDKIGTANIRRKPVIHNKGVYDSIVRKLSRTGFFVEDVRELVPSSVGAGWDVAYKPEQTPKGAVTFTKLRVQRNAQSFNEQASAPQRHLKDSSPPREEEPTKIEFKIPDADYFEFEFELGSKVIPVGIVSDQTLPEEFDLVRGCFGFMDETNKECNYNCIFKSNCAAARLDILSALARKMEGEDVDVREVQQESIQEFESRIS